MAVEDEIADCFEEHGVGNGYAIAESFADFNFTLAQLDSFAGTIKLENLTTVFNWISNLLVTERMLEDILQSSKRIADLVSSVKNFTHMDRAQDKQYADIRLGIKNTLTMLGYKLRKGNIELVEEYDETLPPVKGLIGELNQIRKSVV